MDSAIVPLVRKKVGDITNIDNYRAIALCNVEFKLLETLLLHKLAAIDVSDRHQVGFKKGHSSGVPVLLNVLLSF